jgi:outer membrane cobalamin receptor
MSVYARVNKGGHFGDFDNSLRGNTTGNTPPLQKIRNYEIGFKYQTDWLFADISAYHKQFSGLIYQPSDSAGVPNGAQAIYGADSKGVNVTAVVTPIERLKIQFTGNYLDGHYSHYDACIPYTDILGNNQCAYINGVQLQRQPKFRFFIQPGYTIPMGWGDLTGFLTYTHVGAHTQDISGLQQLGTYNTLDFGVIADIGANWELRLQGTNITNELGLTESNSRIFGSALGTGGVILARPLEGREVNFQVKYKF